MNHDINKITAIIQDGNKQVAQITEDGNSLLIQMNNLAELDTIDSVEFTLRKADIAEVELLKESGVKVHFHHRSAATYYALMVDGFNTDQDLYNYLKGFITVG